MPLSGEKWAAHSEAYAALIAEHLTPTTLWLDAGCGRRLLEDDLQRLEDWLVNHCGAVFGLDSVPAKNRNIRLLVKGSLHALPFAAHSLDLITCNMVIEHLERPANALAEISRCLRSSGVFILKTPNLLNYGVMGNFVASRLLPQEFRLRLVRGSDERLVEDFFPVQYKANTMRELRRLLGASGLQIHKAIALAQRRPYSKRLAAAERALMKLTPASGLLVCAHKTGIQT